MRPMGRRAKKENSKKVRKKTAVKAAARKVAKIAYLNYLKRVERGLPGDGQGDWLAAEQSLQGERSPQLS